MSFGGGPVIGSEAELVFAADRDIRAEDPAVRQPHRELDGERRRGAPVPEVHADVRFVQPLLAVHTQSVC